ncbi:MAG: hypothetical protein AUJ76_02755 [Candidatus Omnitrophica bacterium CG1_02_41_171]|nr:MAG: hypothetical protein AUJ76_02755 [Candidatus Omnitrophica bacterium CG1_02_41_171]
MIKKNFYFIGLLFLLFLSGCGERTFKKSDFLLGTQVEITVIEKNRPKARKALSLAFREIKKKEKSLSYYQAGNDLYRINKSAGKWVKISPELLSLLKMALFYSQLTDGAFNPAYSSGGYKKIIIEEKGRRVKLAEEGMRLDLGGIAKGYIVDETVKLLQKEGIKKGVVNAGGDLKVFGEKIYSIAIRNPFHKKEIFKTIKVKNQAVCTSGNYERPGHIINFRTGKSACELASVTIIAPEAVTADGLATALIVMGREKGEKILQKLNLSYFLIDSEGNVTTNL